MAEHMSAALSRLAPTCLGKEHYAPHPFCIRRGQKLPYPRTKLFENVRTHVIDSLAYTPPEAQETNAQLPEPIRPP